MSNNRALDLEILRGVRRLCNAGLTWQDDNQTGLGAVHWLNLNGHSVPVSFRVIGSETTRNYLKISCASIGEYLIADPQPPSLAPAGRAAGWLRRKIRRWRGLPDTTPKKTTEQELEEQTHFLLEEILRFAERQCLKRYENGDHQAETRKSFWRLLSGKTETPR